MKKSKKYDRFSFFHFLEINDQDLHVWVDKPYHWSRLAGDFYRAASIVHTGGLVFGLHWATLHLHLPIYPLQLCIHHVLHHSDPSFLLRHGGDQEEVNFERFKGNNVIYTKKSLLNIS